jgi:hypothetical protein
MKTHWMAHHRAVSFPIGNRHLKPLQMLASSKLSPHQTRWYTNLVGFYDREILLE